MKYAVAREINIEGEVIGEARRRRQQREATKACWTHIRAR